MAGPWSPAISLTLRNRRLGMHRFAWRQLYAGAEADAPVAACITDAGTLLRARNDGGNVDVARTPNPGDGATFSSWSNVASATAGTAVALAAVPGEVVLLYLGNGGRDLTVRTSADDGVSWSAPSVLYTESSAISDVALSTWKGFGGDLAAFYVRGAEVLHVRRSSGTWGGSGTLWPHGSAVSSLSGVGCWHDGADFQVVLTGVASPSGRPTAWAASVGDFLGVPDAWTSLVAMVDTDAAAAVSFDAPDGFSVFADPWVVFNREQSGDVAEQRAYMTAPASSFSVSETYREPWPLAAAAPDGCAFTSYRDDPRCWVCTTSGVWVAERLAETRDLSGALVAAEWEQSAGRTRARFTLDDSGGDVLTGLAPSVGMDLRVVGDGGVAQLFNIARVERVFAGDGRRTVRLDCVGPWELAAQFEAVRPEVFPPGGDTRGDIFAAIAGRSGVPTTSGGASWTGTPGFALAPGESARSGLLRLMAPTADVVRHEDGFLELHQLVDAAVATWGTGGEPVLWARWLESAPSANWVRLQGDGRVTDAADHSMVHSMGARFDVHRDLGATTNSLAADYAAGLLERRGREAAALELGLPYQEGMRLYDPVWVEVPELDVAGGYRIVGLRAEYARGPKAGKWETVATLAADDDVTV